VRPGKLGKQGARFSSTATTALPESLGLNWGRRLIIGIVVAYVGVLILASVGALIAGALGAGLGSVLTTLADPDAQAAFALTLQIALITVVVNGAFGTIVAWVLTRQRFRGRRIANALIDLPFAVSSVVVGYMLILLFGRLSPLAALEDALGVQVVFAVPGMVLATIFVTLPFMIRELMPAFEALDREQEHAAALLGARHWQTFWLITLPTVRWAMLYGVVLTFARAIGEFGAVLVVGGGIQGFTETAPLYIFRVLDDRNYGAAYSVALVLGMFSLALVLGTERLRKRHHP
jgi:sulfate transport system permease protein